MTREEITMIFEELPTSFCWKCKQDPTTEHDCIKAVETYTLIPLEQMKHKTRKREVVIARQIAQYLICKYTSLSLKSTGEIFGGRDHTTVMHSKKTIVDLMETDPIYFNKISQIEAVILGRTKPVLHKASSKFKKKESAPVIPLATKYSNQKSLYK